MIIFSGIDTSEAWVLSVGGNNVPIDAECLPLDSACEEHTCRWNFAEGGRGLGPRGQGNSACHELQTNHQKIGEHAMKSHTYGINCGVHGVSWGKVAQNRICSGQGKV